MRRQFTLAGLLASTACATAQGPMQRALDASMERSLSVEQYVQAVAGATVVPSRLVRSDGFLYMADVAPQLRYLALSGDTARYRLLRRYAEERMVRRDSGIVQPRRRMRDGAPFEPATAYAAGRFGEALALGWRQLGDTASALLAAQLSSSAPPADLRPTPTDLLAERCLTMEGDAEGDPTAARRFLVTARGFKGGAAGVGESVLGFRASDGDVVVLSCLTRLALQVRDPDASVRFLERMLDRLEGVMGHSGRLEPGAAADVLLAFRAVRMVGPSYYTVLK